MMLHKLRTAPYSLPVLFSLLWLNVAEGVGDLWFPGATASQGHVLHEALKVPSEITK